MIQLITGQQGKGKTTEILNRANEEIKTALGNIVFIDRNTDQMYELNNKIRMIDVSAFAITSSDEFAGFVSGIISQDHDLQTIYFDRLLKCAKIDDAAQAGNLLMKLDKISTMFDINFVVSVSLDKEQIPGELQDKVIIAL